MCGINGDWKPQSEDPERKIEASQLQLTRRGSDILKCWNVTFQVGGSDLQGKIRNFQRDQNSAYMGFIQSWATRLFVELVESSAVHNENTTSKLKDDVN